MRTMTTPEDLFDSLMIDIWPRMGARVDFGLTEENYPAYQKAIREGKLTVTDLVNNIGNGPALSKLIGSNVVTVYDSIPEDK